MPFFHVVALDWARRMGGGDSWRSARLFKDGAGSSKGGVMHCMGVTITLFWTIGQEAGPSKGLMWTGPSHIFTCMEKCKLEFHISIWSHKGELQWKSHSQITYGVRCGNALQWVHSWVHHWPWVVPPKCLPCRQGVGQPYETVSCCQNPLGRHLVQAKRQGYKPMLHITTMIHQLSGN